MAEQFCVAALRHLDTAELLEREGKLDDAGYHYGLAGETAVKHAVATACSFFPSDLRTHFNHRSKPLTKQFWTHRLSLWCWRMVVWEAAWPATWS